MHLFGIRPEEAGDMEYDVLVACMNSAQQWVDNGGKWS